MLHEIIEEMEEAKLLDKETISVVKKGSIITLSSAMILGGTTLAIAGVISATNFLTKKHETEEEEDDDTKSKSYKGIL